MLRDLIVSLYGTGTYNVLSFVLSFHPLWLPLFSGIAFWELWVRYVRYLFFLKTEMVLLEIKLPREVNKSPLAMELALLALHQLGGESTTIAKYWDGKVRAWFSLEIVSLGGEIHFYIWTQKKLRDVLESQLYAQYSDIEISEAPDYAKLAVFTPGTNDMWGCHYVYTKPDALPIKTYSEFGLDKDPKEEYKNDPITSILEFFGTMKPGEQGWLQLVVRAHKKEKRAGFWSSPTDWRKAAETMKKDILKKLKEDGRNVPTKGEAEIIESIERSLGKYPYDVGIRGIYIANEKAKYNSNVPTGMRGLLRAFGSNNLNSFKPDKGTDFDYPWQDYKGWRLNKMKRRMLDAYKRRMFFFYPYHYKTMVMTNEELATMFHVPGQVAATPGLPRIPSKRAQAPSNLPI